MILYNKLLLSRFTSELVSRVELTRSFQLGLVLSIERAKRSCYELDLLFSTYSLVAARAVVQRAPAGAVARARQLAPVRRRVRPERQLLLVRHGHPLVEFEKS
jgi:hypothetical protein